MPQTLILVTILLITQVTELKLLFETQVTKHRFYYVILSALITCIIIEIVIGLVTVYMTQKRVNMLSKVPIEKDKSQKTPPSPSASTKYTQFFNDNPVKQYHIFKPSVSSSKVATSQSTTFIASTSQLRHNLPFVDSSNESLASTCQKLPPIPENSTAADNALFTISRFDEDENPVKTTMGDMTSPTTDPPIKSGCCLGCYRGKSSHNHDRHLLKVWQNFHFYLLYIVMVLNVFITAFGLSGENIKLLESN